MTIKENFIVVIDQMNISLEEFERLNLDFVAENEILGAHFRDKGNFSI